jgi:hypothetical protein
MTSAATPPTFTIVIRCVAKRRPRPFAELVIIATGAGTILQAPAQASGYPAT